MRFWRGRGPTTRGYAAESIWQNNQFALYPRAPGIELHQQLGAQARPDFNLAQTPGLPVRPDKLITLNIGANKASAEDTGLTQGNRNVRIALAAFVPQRVSVTLADRPQPSRSAPGLTVLEFQGIGLPSRLTIGSEVLDLKVFEPDTPLPTSCRRQIPCCSCRGLNWQTRMGVAAQPL